MHPSRSLRARLTLTYGGIALLTALLLGGILLGVLSSYFGRAEGDYLRAASERIIADPPTTADATQLALWAKVYALETQTRIQVFGPQGTQLVDSGSPRTLDTSNLRRPDHGPDGRRDRQPLPDPLGGGFFGAGQRSSTASLKVDLGNGVTATLSEPPASGRDVLASVAEGWLISALLAVALGALAGYLVSLRISKPILALTEASDQMAAGDLDARADVVGHDEVGQLAVSFNEMAGRTQTTVVELRRFVADAAHQIGTPLTALEADLQLAESAATTDNERRLVTRALGQARRLESLSQNLLVLSRLEAGESGGATGLFDLTTLVREAADLIASRVEQAGLVLALDIADEPLPARIERVRIANVVDSLLDNAVKFTREGGTITLGSRRDGQRAVIWVADTGVGIPEAEREQVFSRFHRARNVQAFPGSGLGLAIVRATVEQAGGSVGLDSDADGTRFDVVLPLASETRDAR